MLDQEKKEILENNYVLNKKKDAVRKTIFNNKKKRCSLFGIFLGLVFLLAIYFMSSYSNIYHISVEGNFYLSDEDVIRLSGLSEDTKYLLTFPNYCENKLLNSKLISSANIEMLDNRLVRINVEEIKQVGYIFEDGLSQVLLIDGTRVELTKDNYYLIERIPLIEGYNKTQISEILRGFKLIDNNIINEISEIHRYPFSYDENMMEVIMRDGNYCFVSWTGLNMLSEYYTIISGVDKSYGKVCIYLDELTNSGYASVCPWQQETRKNEDDISVSDKL